VTSEREATTVGNYFVANYPPFSFWRPEHAAEAHARLDRPPRPGTPLGLYVHIPFCRKRCHFCYFRVYTDKDARAIRRYIDAVVAELGMYAGRALVRGRRLDFVYFGGGTPSYLSAAQLDELFSGLRARVPWDGVREVTFEAEPGTVQPQKLEALLASGVTRLSLGVENFDPDILERNNRAHRAEEIERVYAQARALGFPQINIDLIAGMVGETDANWRACIERTLELAPDSVTIYQMEVPYNTTIYRAMQAERREQAPVADWATKRRWVGEAFAALEAHGYEVGSAYTAKRDRDTGFLYRDGLWHGADLIGLGVASFGHLGGVHAQNLHDFEPYLDAVERGELPLYRALVLDDDERLIREFVLQLKLGRVPLAWFRDKFGVDPRERFAAVLRLYASQGFLRIDGDQVVVSREGLLQIDRLLPAFFRSEHQDARYA
jgi:oxygen-independent coproporphyrinogen-3 oxidase